MSKFWNVFVVFYIWYLDFVVLHDEMFWRHMLSWFAVETCLSHGMLYVLSIWCLQSLLSFMIVCPKDMSYYWGMSCPRDALHSLSIWSLLSSLSFMIVCPKEISFHWDMSCPYGLFSLRCLSWWYVFKTCPLIETCLVQEMLYMSCPFGLLMLKVQVNMNAVEMWKEYRVQGGLAIIY